MSKIKTAKALFENTFYRYNKIDMKPKALTHRLTAVNQGLGAEFALISNERLVEISELIMWSTVLPQAKAGLVVLYAFKTKCQSFIHMGENSITAP